MKIRPEQTYQLFLGKGDARMTGPIKISVIHLVGSAGTRPKYPPDFSR